MHPDEHQSLMDSDEYESTKTGIPIVMYLCKGRGDSLAQIAKLAEQSLDIMDVSHIHVIAEILREIRDVAKGDGGVAERGTPHR